MLQKFKNISDSKKAQLSIVAALYIFFNLFAFLISDFISKPPINAQSAKKETVLFWLAYVFTSIAFLLLVFVIRRACGCVPPLKSRLVNVSVMSIVWVYFTAVMLLCMMYMTGSGNAIAVEIAVTTELILFGTAFLLVIGAKQIEDEPEIDDEDFERELMELDNVQRTDDTNGEDSQNAAVQALPYDGNEQESVNVEISEISTDAVTKE